MAKYRKFLIGIVFVILIVVSYFIGCHITEQKFDTERTTHCEMLITFAINKVENEDLSEAGVMKALISNIYAAYQFCDNNESANQLHDLWNHLIFGDNNTIDNTKEIVVRELNAVLYSMTSSPT